MARVLVEQVQSYHKTTVKLPESYRWAGLCTFSLAVFFHVLMLGVYGMRMPPRAMRVWHVRVHMCAARVACRIRLVKKINRSRNSG